jgi:hypothetical protein
VRSVSEETCLTDELDNIIAGLYAPGEQGAEATASPPESPPPSDVAAESEQASDAPSSPETPVESDPPVEPTDDATALAARLAEIEAELQARNEAEATARQQAEERQNHERQLAEWKAQQAHDQTGQQLAKEYGDVDPEWGAKFRSFWQTERQQRDQAYGEAATMRQGFTAFAKASEHLLTPEQFAAIASLSEQLVALPEQHMDQAITQQQQSYAAQRERELRLERENTELRLRIDAIARPPHADAVDAGSMGGSGTADWQNATTFDEFFDGMIAANTSVG